MRAGVASTVERPWWQRWDGLPPSMERGAQEARARRVAEATGWRRHVVGGSVWLPALLGLSQASRVPWAEGWELVLRGGAAAAFGAVALLTHLARRPSP